MSESQQELYERYSANATAARARAFCAEDSARHWQRMANGVLAGENIEANQ